MKDLAFVIPTLPPKGVTQKKNFHRNFKRLTHRLLLVAHAPLFLLCMVQLQRRCQCLVLYSLEQQWRL
jgi:hypothetical protein